MLCVWARKTSSSLRTGPYRTALRPIVLSQLVRRVQRHLQRRNTVPGASHLDLMGTKRRPCQAGIRMALGIMEEQSLICADILASGCRSAEVSGDMIVKYPDRQRQAVRTRYLPWSTAPSRAFRFLSASVELCKASKGS